MKIKVVDAAVQYDCEHTGETYTLVLRNALHVPSMKHNLLPPFISRQAGMVVNDTPKIQVNEPTIDDHSIAFSETGFQIPLSLWGIFSYFPTSKPTVLTMTECEQHLKGELHASPRFTSKFARNLFTSGWFYTRVFLFNKKRIHNGPYIHYVFL